FAKFLQPFAALAGAAPGTGAATPAAGQYEHERDQPRDDQPRRARRIPLLSPHGATSSSCFVAPETAAACRGRHPTVTSSPWAGTAPGASPTFCLTSVRAPPASSSTV